MMCRLTRHPLHPPLPGAVPAVHHREQGGRLAVVGRAVLEQRRLLHDSGATSVDWRLWHCGNAALTARPRFGFSTLALATAQQQGRRERRRMRILLFGLNKLKQALGGALGLLCPRTHRILNERLRDTCRGRTCPRRQRVGELAPRSSDSRDTVRNRLLRFPHKHRRERYS